MPKKKPSPPTPPRGKKNFAVSIERDHKPAPLLWHAAGSLQRIAAREETGSAWVGLGGLVLAAFSIEAYCQQVGPDLFGTEWAQVERESVKEKLRAIAARMGVRVNYGKQPWRDVAVLLGERNKLAHARPATLSGSGVIALKPDEHAADLAHSLVQLDWERLSKPDRLRELMGNCAAALDPIAKAIGDHGWPIPFLDRHSYSVKAYDAEP